jgi:hypothetical protein
MQFGVLRPDCSYLGLIEVGLLSQARRKAYMSSPEHQTEHSPRDWIAVKNDRKSVDMRLPRIVLNVYDRGVRDPEYSQF